MAGNSPSKSVLSTQTSITADIVVRERLDDHTPRSLSLLSSLDINGHETDPANNFQLCTALSMLVRTFLHLIQCAEGVEARIEIPHEGSTIISDIEIQSDQQVWFDGVSALFLRGVCDLAEQFPEKMMLTIQREAVR